MKKVMLIIACTAFSIAIANAQTDTTTTKSKSAQSPTQSSEWVKIKSAEIPSSLRTTFQAPDYKGWETGTIYRNKSSNEYYLEIPSTSSTTPTPYYFDRNGKRVQNPGRGY